MIREVDDVVAAIGIFAKRREERVRQRMRLGMLVVLVVHKRLSIGQKRLIRLGEAAALSHQLEELHIPRGNGAAEHVHLATVVVYVVLALDVVARMRHHVAQRVAERRPAPMTDVHGAYGIGRDELHLYALVFSEIRASEVHALRANSAHHVVRTRRIEIKVDKPRTRDLHAIEQRALAKVRGNRIGDGTRCTARKLGRAHGNRARPVAVGRIGRALEAHVAKRELGQVARCLCGSYGLADEALQLFSHSYPQLQDYQTGTLPHWRGSVPENRFCGAVLRRCFRHVPRRPAFVEDRRGPFRDPPNTFAG